MTWIDDDGWAHADPEDAARQYGEQPPDELRPHSPSRPLFALAAEALVRGDARGSALLLAEADRAETWERRCLGVADLRHADTCEHDYSYPGAECDCGRDASVRRIEALLGEIERAGGTT